MDEHNFDDFTEASYRCLLKQASAKYRFLKFTEALNADAGILWRHDVDISPQRAVALARMEAAEGIVATYFFLLHSDFYNLLERSVADSVRIIAGLGHAVGLHFDPGFYEPQLSSAEAILDRLAFEKTMLQKTSCIPVETFSWHNPTIGNWLSADDDVMAGMVNAYGKSVRDRFRYSSDSNGVWRHERIVDVLLTDEPRLHVLTHPEWWVPEPISPRERVARAVEGRAQATLDRYDVFLETNGRPNIGSRK